MIIKVVKLAFEKAKKETSNRSKTGLATHISKRIEKDYPDRVISYRTFTRYYEKYIEEKMGVIDEPQPDIIEYLCQYLGYEGYEDFVRKNKIKLIIKLLLGFGVISLIMVIIVFSFNTQQKDCMTWSKYNYILVVCPQSHNPKIIPLDTVLLNEFEKIEVDTNSIFFDNNGKAKVWYDKTEGKIEFFNSKGIHPTNGNKLKPITQTIVRKYVFGED
ncbi:hypothetical protein [Aquimarina mytili]|uniref:Uncharacterized protein n=1 Tax=Aquimarina mytili TaxID=874423 RepID=A0A936ZVM9_9FLAO|nr:hypothetical protein [Aquimarina mytili]MBL0682830.1 hypothetical protein [Aquimarina mytili]